MSANLEDPAVATGLEKVDPHPSSKEGSTKQCDNHWTIALVSQDDLERSCLKSCMLDFSIMQTKNIQMSKLGLEKEEEPKIKLPTFAGL